MILSVGGVPDSEWTEEPRYPGTDEPIRHTDECITEKHIEKGWCMESWVNFDDKKVSKWWTVCTF
jgi:hypothetical protein